VTTRNFQPSVNFTGARNYVENPLHQDDGHHLFLKTFAEVAPAAKKTTISTPVAVTVKRDIKALPNYVDEAERKRRREAGLCIKCGIAGHTIKDCKVGWKLVREEKGKIAEEEMSEQSGKE
jgi:hypothetical protein